MNAFALDIIAVTLRKDLIISSVRMIWSISSVFKDATFSTLKSQKHFRIVSLLRIINSQLNPACIDSNTRYSNSF